MLVNVRLSRMSQLQFSKRAFNWMKCEQKLKLINQVIQSKAFYPASRHYFTNKMVETTQTHQQQQKPKVDEDLTKKYRRRDVEDLLKRKFFVTPSFEIYGGVSGFFDFGPLGSAVKNNVESLWRQHFVLEEDMLEVGCTCLTYSEVLKTSGHVDKFEDLMVKDVKTGTPKRADKLINEWIAKVLPKKKKPEERAELEKLSIDVDNFNAAQIDEVIAKFQIKDPETGNDLTKAEPFNLMFGTMIGPTGQMKGYLRPETAQGIFINFRRLLEYNNGKMPFAAAQIGLGFRNEIAPRQGLLRVREFTMAEIEHFCDPKDKTHPKFKFVAEVQLPLLSAKSQDDGNMNPIQTSIGEAVSTGLVNNETLGYFLARSYQFLVSCGIKSTAIRFRQHRSTEMAHYSSDCWDAEVETSYGWIEIAGHADRSAYDLTKHMEKTKVELVAARPLKEVYTETLIVVSPNKQLIGKEFKKDGQAILNYFANASQEELKANKATFEDGKILKLTIEGKEFTLGETQISFETQTKTHQEEKYTPNVIEPSFGIGRVIYCIFEHCFKSRESDAQRTYFDFPPLIAPLKCSILPLIKNGDLDKKVFSIKQLLVKAGVSNKVDDSGQTVGKRYARTDECGIPFAITVDFDTLKDDTVTLRGLDSMKQIRLPVADLSALILGLSNAQTTWKEAVDKYGLYEQAAKEEDK